MATKKEMAIASKIKLKESGEPFVNVKDYSPKIIIRIESTSRKQQKLKKGDCFARKGAVTRLVKAQSALPEGVHIKIIDGYRPLKAQREIHKQFFEKFRKEHPDWSNEEVMEEADNWVANPDKVTPPHSTGGTFDLTLADVRGKELNMGTPVNTADAKRAITRSKYISKAERKNRNMLISAMTKAGFVNNRMEWWHWSYGDWRWAAAKKTYAIYSGK